MTGQLTWIKPAVAKTLYPLGFTNELINLLGSLYTNTLPAGLPVLNLTNATLVLSNGNLAQPLTYSVGLGVNNTLTNLGGPGSPANPLTIQINPNNGVRSPVTFEATACQDDTIAHGARSSKPRPTSSAPSAAPPSPALSLSSKTMAGGIRPREWWGIFSGGRA